MLSKEDLTVTASISQSLINKTALNRGFHKKTTEKIIRSEVRNTKKKFNTITLAISGSIILLASILIILQITKSLFANDIMIPIILCIVVVAIMVIFAIDYFTVKSQGEKTLQVHLGPVDTWVEKIKVLQRKNTRIYNGVKKAFDSVIEVDSKFIVNGFILRYYFTMTKIEQAFDPEKLYEYLFFITTKKNFSLEKILSKEEETEEASKEELLQQIKIHLENFRFILSELLSKNKLPLYFIDRINSTIEIIDQFNNQKNSKKE